VPLAPHDFRLSTLLGVTLLAGAMVLPAVLHPLTWGALWLLAEPLLYRVDPQRSLFGDIGRGAWGRIVRLMFGGLVAGVLWEAYNALSRAKWIYTVPFLEQLKIFEMPPLGFVGFAFFALEAWSLYHLCRAWRSAWRAAFALGFVVLALLGLDRWTVSSTLPYVDDLPGVSATARTRLERGGLRDVFRLAALAPDSVAARSGLPPGGGDGGAARDAARDRDAARGPAPGRRRHERRAARPRRSRQSVARPPPRPPPHPGRGSRLGAGGPPRAWFRVVT